MKKTSDHIVGTMVRGETSFVVFQLRHVCMYNFLGVVLSLTTDFFCSWAVRAGASLEACMVLYYVGQGTRYPLGLS